MFHNWQFSVGSQGPATFADDDNNAWQCCSLPYSCLSCVLVYSSCFLTSLGSRFLAIFVGGNYPPHRDLTTTHQKHPDTIFVNVPERSTRMRQDICAVCLHLLQKTSWHGMHFLPGVMPPQIIRKALKDLGPEKSRRVPRGADRSSSTGTDSLQGDWPVRRWRGSWPQQWLKKEFTTSDKKLDAFKMNFRNCLSFPHWKCGNEMMRFPIIMLTFSNMFLSASTDFHPASFFVCSFTLARLRDRVSDRLPSRKAASFPWHWMLWSQFSSGEVKLRLFFEMALNVPKEGAKANGVGYGWTE